MIEKIYKICYWIFFIESLLILIGMFSGVISYGIDVQTPIMSIGIVIGVVIGTIIRLILQKTNSIEKKILAITFAAVFLFLSIYYLVEDQFRILINFVY